MKRGEKSSDTVKEMLLVLHGLSYSDHGNQGLRNIPAPVRSSPSKH